jgi:exodeoxyribonuclease V gamma subunit
MGGAGARSGVVLHRSSRVEALLDPLTSWIGDTLPSDPLVPVRIVVQSRGMERWLSHQLAMRLGTPGAGVAASLEFPFPGRYLHAVALACGAVDETDDPWAPDRLALSIARELLETPAAPELASVLRAADDDLVSGVVGRGTWRLARAIADVFDRYLLHRAGMVTGWSAGDDLGGDRRPLDAADRWQPWLWRRLTDRIGDPSTRLAQVLARLADPRPVPELPVPIAFFGLSSLPPAHLEVVAALGGHGPVALFVPTPSPRRWGAALDVRPANPLLAACGRLADEATGLLADVVDHDVALDDLAQATDADTLLGRLQADVRADRPPANRPGERAVGGAGDRSLQIHRCYGPSRQADALRDVVLGLLDDDPTLEPRDVLVLCPDVEAFAPLVSAAFAGDGRRPDLPVQVADRRAAHVDAVAEALLALLRTLEGRMSASALVDLLAMDPIARRLGLGSAELDRITRWVRAVGVRWGADADHRLAYGQPPDRGHTWEAGLDRLLLGLVMADEDERVVGDVVPFDDVEGDDADLLGTLADRCRRLFALARDARRGRPVADWCALALGLLDEWVEVSDDERPRSPQLAALLEAFASEGGTEPFTLAAYLDALERRLDAPRGASGYLTGAVTLCELVPMRSIPHRVVCLLGIDDGMFPRAAPSSGFDLLTRAPRPGDPDRRNEDRHLFLEAVLAAREHLVVACTGRDVRTNEEWPFAAVVAELVDAVGRAGGAGAEAIVVDHPLHPFSPTLFGAQGPPRSFDVALLDAARAVTAPAEGTDFLAAPLRARRIEDVGPVGLDVLADALASPIDWLLAERLGIRFDDHDERLEDLDPLALDGRSRWRLGTDALARAVSGSDLESWRATAPRRPHVPSGPPGDVALDALVAEVDAIAEARRHLIRRLGDADPIVDDDLAAEVSLEVGGTTRTLAGRVTGRCTIGDVQARILMDFRRMGGRARLQLWITHLAMVASGIAEGFSILVARGGGRGRNAAETLVLGPLDDPEPAARARTLLADLVALHDAATRRPLPLFPRASYLRAAGRSDSEVARAFFDDHRGFGDRTEAVELVYGTDAAFEQVLDRVGDEFAELAQRVYGPMIATAAHAERQLAARTGTTS